MRHYIILAALLALTACGTRGGLYMPPGMQPPPPMLGKPAPPQPAGKTTETADTATRQGADDLNTAKEPQK